MLPSAVEERVGAEGAELVGVGVGGIGVGVAHAGQRQLFPPLMGGQAQLVVRVTSLSTVEQSV